MSGPYGHLEYQRGEFHVKKEDQILIKHASKIGMIAGGTGITPMFQLIQKIVSTREMTGLSLIYCTKLIEELAFCEDLVRFDRKGSLSFYPVVETPFATKWDFGTGLITQEMIENYMPSPKDQDSVIFLCGSKQMIEDSLKPMLRAMNYSNDNILSFH